MGSFSIGHWLLVGLIVLVLFGGRGKISDIMGDMAKGIKSFKKGLQDSEEDVAKASDPQKRLDAQSAQTMDKASDPHKV
jgi:sec-independent protein translocase protein TatA